MLLTGFHGLHRLSQLTQPDTVAYQDNQMVILRPSLSFLRITSYYIVRLTPFFRAVKLCLPPTGSQLSSL